MTLVDDLKARWADLDKSAQAQTLAKSFLRGFEIAAAIVITPYVAAIMHDPGDGLRQLGTALIHQNLAYDFFNDGFKSAIGYAFGQYIPSPADKPKPTTT